MLIGILSHIISFKLLLASLLAASKINLSEKLTLTHDEKNNNLYFGQIFTQYQKSFKVYLDRLREPLVVRRNCHDHVGRVEKLLVGVHGSNPGPVMILEIKHWPYENLPLNYEYYKYSPFQNISAKDTFLQY